ncbi:YncE family protein [Gabonibacter chumensis]|uniref:YncE family protein n=1 Tax=Gabonibacter chumensis TaxID=2972474 RepID=UPI002574826F|nr:YncE family protein [Gabonibacter chumensis]MCR9011378.1 YncE family protein [Gabonibacter chumensis]
MSKLKFYVCMFFLAGAFLLSSCRNDDEEIISSVITQVAPSDSVSGPIKGFFLLNEGNMGSNKATLDYFDYTTGKYHKNIFPERNPSVVKELGDVGNDIQIYGNKLYAVINASNLVEVMDVNTAKHIGTISIPNCRYIVFDKGYAYVSSYAGKIEIDPNARLGYVAKVDTATLQILDSCTVGYQPEEMVIAGNKLYAANSGGYRFPNYDNTVSVIDLNSFKEIKKIPVAINLHRMKIDRNANIYVTSRGDYKNIHSNTYVIDPRKDIVTDVLNFPASELYLCGDSLYAYSTEYSKITEKNTVTYAIYNTKTKRIVTRNFIKDGTELSIKVPYSLAVDPRTREIYISDAKDYVTPGTLYCFTPDGKKKWEVTTGDIPAHIVFTTKPLKDLK